MSPEQVDLLLRKQQLRWRIAEQRAQCLGVLQEVERLLSVAQQGRRLVARLGSLLREHAALGVLAGGLVLLARPRAALRWSRRGWLLWLGWRRHHGLLRGWARWLGRLTGA